MSDILRQIVQKLVITNYKRLYQLKVKKSSTNGNQISPKILSIVAICCSLAIISCKDEKTKANQAKPEVKESIKTSETTTTADEKVILFYGNSLTAGYMLEENESFPSRISDIIDSLGLKYNVVNAGLSGETTSGGLKRIDWVMKQKVDIFILELGANDMLRGLPIDQTRINLAKIIETVQAKNPDVKIGLCEMMAPPNMGDDYVKEFTKIYKDLSKPDNIVFFPFFLDGVASNPDLLLQDGKHPNAKGQLIVADNVWRVLEGML